MKKLFVFTLAAAVVLIIAVPGAWAQDTATDEFTLEEIMVTAERRAVNVQQIPASVVALPGDDLVTQGKVTVEQMLEDVPNVMVLDGSGRGGHGPNSNIAVRGVQRTQDAGGGSPIPSSTATYVDGVYDGIGGSYDIDRIEVLRGPQGTLYGRAAAGGVVAFYTKNPKLEEFGGNVFAEYGTASRINTQAAVNVPVGDTFAFRAAFHYFHQDEGYWTGDGVESETKEGRIKALFQPSENFSAILSLSATETQDWGGGWTQQLSDPDTIIYEGSYGDPNPADPKEYIQGSLEVDYDLGDSALTYIAAIHEIDDRGSAAVSFNRGSYMANNRTGTPRKTQTHEIRWASDTDSALSWLFGASYYHYKYHSDTHMMQVSVPGHPDQEHTTMAPIAIQRNRGNITEYGIFTEETFELSDDMRLTAGLRYDKNKIEDFPSFDFNFNLDGPASLNPPIWEYMDERPDKPTFENWTYKLRFEYDLTPENMLYATTATGYLPGMSQISPQPDFAAGEVVFSVLPYDQKEVTSYELGTKNRFLDNRLQLNGALFYLDYEGYAEAVNITPGQPPPPMFMVVTVPVKMIGIELDGTWLITPNDKITFSAGWLDAKIDGNPDLPDTIFDREDMMYLERLPGIPEVTVTLAYDHTFILGNGSTLVPRAEARYTSGHYVSQLTASEAEVGWLPYMHQDDFVLFNIAATWTSPEDRYSITAYGRNVSDEEYKTQVQTAHVATDPASVELGDPQTFGVMAGVKF